jgi:hypothetical protein
LRDNAALVLAREVQRVTSTEANIREHTERPYIGGKAVVMYLFA